MLKYIYYIALMAGLSMSFMFACYADEDRSCSNPGIDRDVLILAYNMQGRITTNCHGEWDASYECYVKEDLSLGSCLPPQIKNGKLNLQIDDSICQDSGLDKTYLEVTQAVSGKVTTTCRDKWTEPRECGVGLNLTLYDCVYFLQENIQYTPLKKDSYTLCREAYKETYCDKFDNTIAGYIEKGVRPIVAILYSLLIIPSPYIEGLLTIFLYFVIIVVGSIIILCMSRLRGHRLRCILLLVGICLFLYMGGSSLSIYGKEASAYYSGDYDNPGKIVYLSWFSLRTLGFAIVMWSIAGYFISIFIGFFKNVHHGNDMGEEIRRRIEENEVHK